jgi:hypothetical protein
MKEKIDRMSIESAFKALDTFEIPEASKKTKKIQESFKTETQRFNDNFESLNEEYYDVQSKEDMQEVKDSREDEIAKAKLARIEKIVDLDAKSPEDLLPSYAGKTIIQCPQCMTLFYKDEKDLIPSEEDPSIVNVEETCQHCGNTSGYNIIGKVAPVEEDELETFEETEEQTDNNLNEVPTEENAEDDLDAFNQDFDSDEVVEDEVDKEEADEADEAEEATEEAEGEDEKEEDKEKKKEESLENSNSQVLNEEVVNEAEVLNPDTPVSEADLNKMLDDKEFKTPVTDAEVEANFSEDLDLESLDEIDEKAVSECITKALKEAYTDTDNFFVSDCRIEDKNLIIEGVILDKSGESRTVSYKFNEGKVDQTRKFCLTSLNEGYELKLNGTLQDAGKYLYIESLNYSYNLDNKLVEGLVRK